MDDKERSRLDVIIDLLADEVAKRIEERSESKPLETVPSPVGPSTTTGLASVEATEGPAPEAQGELTLEPGHELEAEPVSWLEPEATPEPPVVMPLLAVSAPSHAASLMARLALGILLIVMLINIPFNDQGLTLARSIPNSDSLVIKDGLLVKEETSPDVYVYRDGAFHWVTSLEALQYYRYRWEDVHAVEPGFLSRFEKGNPLLVLLKCDGSPHVFGIEEGRKRWIVDIPTFESEGYVWKDIKFVPCTYLRSLSDGESVPPGRGSPPPPLP